MSSNRRILLIDDSKSIHQDFTKILGATNSNPKKDEALADFFEEEAEDAPAEIPAYVLSSAMQGEDGYELVKAAKERGEPFAVAFVDVRMPPGWDGVQTIEAIWKVDPDIQIVMCTAFSDYTWTETMQRLGCSDNLLILKKPFDPIEISQAANALTEKWNARIRELELVDGVRKAEQEARAYASSLETVNRTLATAKAASDKALEVKTDFLTGLTGSINRVLEEIFAGVAGLRQLPGCDASLVDGLLENGQRLMDVLLQISDLNQLEMGQVEVERKACDPFTLVEQVLGEMAPLAISRGLALEYETTGSVPAHIQTDPRRLVSILRHLVRNAIEHTTQGSVRVYLSMNGTDDWRHQRFTFSVVDTGSGIAHQHQSNLFEPFFSVEDGGSITTAQSGLGLSLSRRLAHFLHGDIRVESLAGNGSTFCFGIEAGNLVGVDMVKGRLGSFGARSDVA